MYVFYRYCFTEEFGGEKIWRVFQVTILCSKAYGSQVLFVPCHNELSIHVYVYACKYIPLIPNRLIVSFSLLHAQCLSPPQVKNCDLAWLWESWGRCRKYHIVDASRGQYVVLSEPAPGPQVTCMTKVNDCMWVANKVRRKGHFI